MVLELPSQAVCGEPEAPEAWATVTSRSSSSYCSPSGET
jgi:hypothetical protein